MSKLDQHCKDCCCARSWAALGITAYTGKSISEHIDDLKVERDAALYERDIAVIKYIRLADQIQLAWRNYDGPLSFGEFALAGIGGRLKS